MKSVVTARLYKGQKGVWEIDISITYRLRRAPYRVRLKSAEKTERASISWGYSLVPDLEEELREELKSYGRPLTAKERRHKAHEVKAQEKGAAKARACPTLSQFVPRFLEGAILGKGHTKTTYALRVRQINAYLLPLFGDRPLDQIKAEDFTKLIASLTHTRQGTPRGKKQINDIVALLYQILETARVFEEISHLPPRPDRLVAAPPDIECYSEEEYERLAKAARTLGWQPHLLVLLGGLAGLRLGELLALSWKDLDLKAGYLMVRKQETEAKEVTAPKSKKSRRVKLRVQLQEALEAAKHLGDWVLLRDDGSHPNTYQIRAWLASAERKAGLVIHKSPHRLRHYFASILAAKRVAPSAIQALLGHASMQTTLRYLHLLPGEADRAIEELDRAERGERVENKR